MKPDSSAISIGALDTESKLGVEPPSAVLVSKRLAIIVLIGLVVLLIVARLHTYQEPLERDITTYAVIAHELLQGRELYTDLWDHKPPAIHLTYAAAESLVGYGEASIFLLNIAAAVVSLLGAYAAGSVGARGREGGVWAAALWLLISGDLTLQANQPNTEVFINAAMLWTFALYLRGDVGALSWSRAVAIGALGFIASFYKPHQLVISAALAAAALALGPPAERGRQLIKAVAIAVMIGSGWAATWLYFATQGRAQAFREAVFDYNRTYVGSLLENLTTSLRSSAFIGHSLAPLACLFVLVGLGIAMGIRRAAIPWTMLIAFGFATHLVIAVPGQFHAHYYQQWFPPLVVGGAWTIVDVGRRLAARPWWASRGLGIVAVIGLCVIELPAYGRPATAWSLEKYGDVFVASKRLGVHIDGMLAPNETFYEWGNETGLYFASRRTPPSGMLQAYPFVEWSNPRRATSGRTPESLDARYADLYERAPFVERLETRLLSELERARPELLVLHNAWPLPPPRVRAWTLEHYRPFAFVNGFFLAYRDGGALHARLRLRR